MATIPSPPRFGATDAEVEYPTGDGRPVAETPLHFQNLSTAVQTLERYFAQDPMVYTWGNMFVYYEQGNRHKHVAPDVFVAVGVPKDKPRKAYFTWQEGHGLDFVIELTSQSTKEEDIDDKMSIYRDKIKVSEYFLFDPNDEYLDPPLQGYRLRAGKYIRVEMVEGRLPSEITGLHLERDGAWLRFYSPATGAWLPTPAERETTLEAARERAEAQRESEQAARRRAEAQRESEQAARRRAEARHENEKAARERAEAQRESEQTARERAETERERLAAELRGSEAELKRLRQELEQLRGSLGDRPRRAHDAKD